MNDSDSKVRLYESRGETSVFIWGDSDYEYWLYVSQENKDLLLISLIKKMFGGSSEAFSKFRELLIEFKIPYQFDSWV